MTLTPSARRTLATRAHFAALALRRLAKSLDVLPSVLATERARGIVEADRSEASGALGRLVSTLFGYTGSTLVTHHEERLDPYEQQIDVTADRATPAVLRGLAYVWDLYAEEIDP